MTKKFFNCNLGVYIALFCMIIILVIVGMKNFYKHSTKKEILSQKINIYLKDNGELTKS